MIGTAVLVIVFVLLINFLVYLLNANSFPRRKLLPRPTLYFASNRKLKPRPEQYWALDTLDPDHLTTSFFVPIWVLAAWRLFTGAFFGAELLIEGFTTRNGLGNPGYVWLSFFTDWTFMLFCFAGLLGFAVTVHRQLVRRRTGKVEPAAAPAATKPHAATPAAEADPEAAIAPEAAATSAVGTAPAVPTDADDEPAAAAVEAHRVAVRKWTPLEVFYLLVFETSASSSLFLTVFYWVALADEGGVSADNVMKHGANNAVILVDVWLSRMPFSSYHFQVALWYGTMYLIFMWAVWLPVRDYWVYSVFDWDRWRSIGAYAILPIALFAAFAIWVGIAALREAVGRRFAIRRWSTAVLPPHLPNNSRTADNQLQSDGGISVAGCGSATSAPLAEGFVGNPKRGDFAGTGDGFAQNGILVTANSPDVLQPNAENGFASQQPKASQLHEAPFTQGQVA